MTRQEPADRQNVPSHGVDLVKSFSKSQPKAGSGGTFFECWTLGLLLRFLRTQSL